MLNDNGNRKNSHQEAKAMKKKRLWSQYLFEVTPSITEK
jgi:hypothetical protein